MKEEKKSSNETHAWYSPSSSSRWLYCTKSLVLPQKPYQTNEFAQRGTALHLLAEKILKGKLTKPSYKNYEWTEEDLNETVKPYVDYVNDIKNKTNPKTTHLFLEQRVFIDLKCWGTVDALIYDEETKVLNVIDLKAGKGVFVHNNDNLQLAVYAIGAINFLRKKKMLVDKIFVHIVQPALDNITSQELFKKDLKVFRNKILETMEKVENGDTVYSPSEDRCRWCNVVECPKLQEIATKACEADFRSISLSEKMDMVEPLKAFIKRTENQVYTALDVGEEVGDYYLRPTAPRRYFIEEKKARKFLKGLGCSKKEVYSVPKLLSVSQVEKVLKKKLDKEEFKVVKEEMNDVDSGLVEKKSGSLQITKRN